MHRYGGGLVEGETRDSSSAPPDSKQGGVPSKTPADSVVVSVASVPHSDVYHMGVPSQRSSIVIQRPGQRTHQKWKVLSPFKIIGYMMTGLMTLNRNCPQMMKMDSKKLMLWSN